MSPMSSIAIATCLSVIHYGYLQSTMPTCSVLWLPAVYCGYPQCTLATCIVLWLPVVYYGYTYSLLSVLPIGFYMQQYSIR